MAIHNSDELRVHGSLFFLLRKFVSKIHSPQHWVGILDELGFRDREYEITQSYPMVEFDRIVDLAGKKSLKNRHELLEEFGQMIVPDLFSLYKDYLNPSWRTLQVLENTEQVMHGAVRRLNSTAYPPVLDVSRISPTVVLIDYYSKRRMGSLALGIIRGIAGFYNEQDAIAADLITAPEDFHVQIKVEQKK